MNGGIPVPEVGSPWYPDVANFALSYNAYDREGSFDAVASRANELRDSWDAGAPLPGELHHVAHRPLL
jgi:hypothetical protein